MSGTWLQQLVSNNSAKRRLRVLLFIYLALVLCPIHYWPIAPDGDNTWFFAMNYAASHHLVMGQDIVWTSGPLTWLAVPQDVGGNLPRALLFQAALWILLLAILWDVLFRSNFSLRNLALFAIFIVFSSARYPLALGLADILIAGALVLLLQFELRAGTTRYITALAMLGVVPAIKFVGAIVVAGIIAGLVVDRWVRRQRGAVWQALSAIAIPACVSALTWWFAVGSFRTLPAYIKGSLELSRGYSLAMSVAGPPTELIAAAETLVFLIVALIFLRSQQRSIARFLIFVLTIPVLVNIKHGFVRQDAHISHFFCFVALALGLVALVIRLTEQRTIVTFAAITLLFGAIWQDNVVRTDARAAFEGTGITTPWRVAQALWFPNLRRSLNAKSQHNFPPNLRLEPQIRDAIQQQSVASLSVSFNELFLEGVNLVLYPVPQRYSAYTPYLDQLNADWVRKKGPHFLIFDGTTIDGRHPWMDTPAMWLEVYRWYDTRMLGKRTLLLERRSTPRFRRLEYFAESQMKFGQDSHVLMTSDPLFWTMQCSLTTTAKLRALLFRVPEVTMAVHEDGQEERIFRVLPAVLVSPSLGDRVPADLKDFAEVFGAGGGHKFSVNTLTFGGPGAAAYNPGCDVEWLRPVP
ncbi:MAG TPA: hypothetical protein VJA94_19800 [Candidatus Angelobacter sp.]